MKFYTRVARILLPVDVIAASVMPQINHNCRPALPSSGFGVFTHLSRGWEAGHIKFSIP